MWFFTHASLLFAHCATKKNTARKNPCAKNHKTNWKILCFTVGGVGVIQGAVKQGKRVYYRGNDFRRGNDEGILGKRVWLFGSVTSLWTHISVCSVG